MICYWYGKGRWKIVEYLLYGLISVNVLRKLLKKIKDEIKSNELSIFVVVINEDIATYSCRKQSLTAMV